MQFRHLIKKFILPLICLTLIPLSSNAFTSAFVYNPKTLTWKAYDDYGNVIASGRGSGGSSYCHDIQRPCHTPVGTFYIKSKQGAGCKSSRYPIGRGGSPMPYCSFFTTNYAIHGSYEVKNYNASHGCIRVHPKDAKWLQNNFLNIGTKVIVLPY